MTRAIDRLRKLGLITTLIILLAQMLIIAVAPAEGQAEEWVTVERGENYVRRRKVGTNTYSWESAPAWVKSGESYVPYVLVDSYEAEGFYQVQLGLVAARIYDYYAEFYSPDMAEVRVSSEMWEVQRYRNGKWSDLGAQSGEPFFKVSAGETCVNMTKTFNSWAGTLSISYIFREGSPLKHTVTFTSDLAGNETFRILQKWSGIAATRVEQDGPIFRFEREDGSLAVVENQYRALEKLEPVEVETQAGGMKADFIFSNWTLALGEILELDPTTITLEPPTKDTYIDNNVGMQNNNYGDEEYMQIHYDGGPSRRVLIEWDITSIPEEGNTSLVKLKLYAYDNNRAFTLYLNRIIGSWTEMGVTWNNQPSVSSTNQADVYFPDDTPVWWEADVTEQFKDALAAGDTYGVRIRETETGDPPTSRWVKFRTKEYSTSLDPQLYVEYIFHTPEVISASIPDRDDGDNLYAMRKHYAFTTVVDDPYGADTIYEVRLRSKDGAATLFEVKATDLNSTPAYSIVSGANVIDLDAGSCSWQENGDEGTATFKIRIEADHAQKDDLELAIYVEDDDGYDSGWVVKQTDYFDIVNRLVTDGLAPEDGWINISASTTISGGVRYATTTGGNTASSLCPPDDQFTAVRIHDSGHAVKASDTSIIDGAFSASFNIPSSVGENLYHVYLDMAGDWADGDTQDGDTATVVGDRWKLSAIWASDESPLVNEVVYIYVTGSLEHDGHAPDGDDALVIEGYTFTWDWEEERYYKTLTRNTTGSITLDELTSVNEATYGITVGTMDGKSVTVTWKACSFTFLGLYSENGTFIGAVNVSAHKPSETEIFEVDGNTTKNFMERPIMLSFALSGGGTRYIYPFEDDETIYIFAPNDDYGIYSFTIRDYTGNVGPDDAWLESLRAVNGTEHLIERMLIRNMANTVPLTLVQSQIYVLQVRLIDGTVHRFGFFIPGAEATPTLNIYGLAFSDQAHLVGEYLTVEGIRPADTHIRVNYKDELDDTDQVFVEVCLLNGSQVVNDTASGDILQFNFYDLGNETDYMVKAAIDHGFYGVVNYTCWLAGAQADFWEAPDLGLFGDWPMKNAFSVFIIIGAACLFSRISAVVGMGVTVFIAAALTRIGWIGIPWTVLAAAFTLVVLWGIAGGGK